VSIKNPAAATDLALQSASCGARPFGQPSPSSLGMPLKGPLLDDVVGPVPYAEPTVLNTPRATEGTPKMAASTCVLDLLSNARQKTIVEGSVPPARPSLCLEPALAEDAALQRSLAAELPGPSRGDPVPAPTLPAASGHAPAQPVFCVQVGKHEVRDTGRPFTLEVFGGSGSFTRALRDVGLDAWSIDYSGGRLASVTPAALLIDLSFDHGQELFGRLLLHPRLAYVHFAPPCGTASRAREIKMKNGPMPLRSDEFPEGLPNLEATSPKEYQRVLAANRLYSFVAASCRTLSARGVPWSIENPASSLFWLVPCTASLVADAATSSVYFHHCMFGGSRPKRTRWAHQPASIFADLARDCNHKAGEHASWGRTAGGFATAAETVYPDGLCRAAAELVLSFLAERRLPPLELEATRKPQATKRAVQENRAAAGIQARGARHSRLLPEFERTIMLPTDFGTEDPRTTPGHRWSAQAVEGIDIPKGSVTTRVVWKGVPGHGAGTDQAPPTRTSLAEIGGGSWASTTSTSDANTGQGMGDSLPDRCGPTPSS